MTLSGTSFNSKTNLNIQDSKDRCGFVMVGSTESTKHLVFTISGSEMLTCSKCPFTFALPLQFTHV